MPWEHVMLPYYVLFSEHQSSVLWMAVKLQLRDNWNVFRFECLFANKATNSILSEDMQFLYFLFPQVLQLDEVGK